MRCSKCLMPSYLPNSKFNQSGECFWCQTNFPDYSPKGTKELSEILELNRSKSGSADCLVGVSGGKDSSYILMELQRTYNMNVEAFTYTHEGLKPFALENVKAICKDFGIEHHVVSLPKNKHSQIFKDFFKVWIKSPTLLTVNFPCIACKHLHLLGSKLAIKRKIPMIFWGMSPFENPPLTAIDREGAKDIEQGNMIKNAMLFSKEMLSSRNFLITVIKHLPTCFYGCMAVSPTTSYIKYRYSSVKQILFYDYVNWNPSSMIESLVANTSWKRPVGVSDWHSDCFFGIIKNYMYQKTLGITYMDAYLSNQIRHGLISRDRAWDILVASKNDSWERFKEALDYIGLSYLIKEMDENCFDITEKIE